MPLFLVEGRIRRTQYMATDSVWSDDTRIVEAETESEAQDLYEKFWSLMTEEYCVYYYAETVSINAVITKQAISGMVAAKAK